MLHMDPVPAPHHPLPYPLLLFHHPQCPVTGAINHQKKKRRRRGRRKQKKKKKEKEKPKKEKEKSNKVYKVRNRRNGTK